MDSSFYTKLMQKGKAGIYNYQEPVKQLTKFQIEYLNE